MSSYPIIFGGGLDPDASRYFQRAGVTNSTAKTQLNNFVKGVKRLGLWNSMVCWPLRSSQNAGTGTTAYSLGGLGTYNATLINGPTWGENGITATGTTGSYLFVPSYPVVTSNHSLFGIQTATIVGASGGFANVISTGGGSGQLFGRLVLYGFTGASNYNTGAYFRPLTGGSGLAGTSETSLNYSTPYWRAGSFRIDITSLSHIINGTLIQDSAPTNGTGTLPFTDSNAGINMMVTQIAGNNNISPFMGVCTGYLTPAQHESIRILYKSTLGVGIGLS
jgi:hypothetical protein